MKNLKRILATLIFIGVFAVVFSRTSNLLMHKQVEGQWNMTAKVVGFFNEKPRSFDVLFFGSSHMYCALDPSVLEKETGLTSYVLATQQQPLWITYYYMVDALKTQNPKVMVVEVNMVTQIEDYMDDGTNYTAIDPIPFSKTKIDMILASAPKGQQRYYIFNIMKYHQRWEELKKLDFQRTYETSTDPAKGYVGLPTADSTVKREDLSKVTQVKIGSEKNILYMNKMMDLAEKKGFRLIFLKTPSNATAGEKIYYNGAAAAALSRGHEFIDYNTDELYKEAGLIPSADFFDRRHLNESGMKKFTAHFGRYLTGN